ncbi:MAG: hypothetical protein ABIH11_08075 [Candidatus Altiarchaeota archaeon]
MIALATNVSAGLFDKVITFVNSLQYSVLVMGNSICEVMFVYGGLKYIFSADDPSGRKTGLNICIAATIGALLIVISKEVVSVIVVT